MGHIGPRASSLLHHEVERNSTDNLDRDARESGWLKFPSSGRLDRYVLQYFLAGLSQSVFRSQTLRSAGLVISNNSIRQGENFNTP